MQGEIGNEINKEENKKRAGFKERSINCHFNFWHESKKPEERCTNKKYDRS